MKATRKALLGEIMNSEQPVTLSEKDILSAPESDYMNESQLEFFKQRLVDLHETTRARIEEAKEQMNNSSGLSDEHDRASYEEQAALALRIVDREQKLLVKIQESLERIRIGEYGYCLESGEPIGISRLLARPTAEYSIEVKTLKEVKEHHYKKQSRDLD